MPAKRKRKTVTTPSCDSIPRCSAILRSRIFRFRSPLILFGLLLSLWCWNPATAVPASASPDKKAAQDYALIYGTVWGPDDRPVYGVPVEIRRTDQKKGHWHLYSNHQGEFAQRVPVGPGDYVVWADLKGVKSPQGVPLHLDQEVKVHIDNDEREDIGLHLK